MTDRPAAQKFGLRGARPARPAGTADNRPMIPCRVPLAGALAAGLLLAACSPALNWRSVPWPEAAITATLPCKPDRATRTVELAGVPVEMSMVGCDADGATWAVSHVALADPARAGVALAHWRAAVVAQLGPDAAASARDTPFAPLGVLPLPQSVRTLAQGRRPGGGAPVHAQGVWFARAVGPQMRLYHAVVYAPQERAGAADTFFAGLSFP